MALNTFTGGTAAVAAEVNENFSGNKVTQVYTGTGFDVSSSANGTTTSAFELDAITSSALGGADYVKVSITTTSRSQEESSGNTGLCTLRLEAKEVGGSYIDTLPTTNINVTTITSNAENNFVTQAKTLEIIHTLTAGEKTNGVQFRVTGGVVNSAALGSVTTVSNINTLVSTLIG